MFREMRRKKQQLSNSECFEILDNSNTAVLALIGDGGYPYTVPLNFVRLDNKVYFHCAKTGHKIDAVKNCDKASLCVVGRDDVLAEKYTTLHPNALATSATLLPMLPSPAIPHVFPLSSLNTLSKCVKHGLLTYSPDFTYSS